jgi:flagellar biosynthetic protein FlhB
MSAAGDRTEKATPKRVRKARHDGQIGNTPEIGAWLGLLAATFVVPHVFRSVLAQSRAEMVQLGAVIEHPEVGHAVALAQQAVRSAFTAVLPMALLIAVIGVLSVAAQGGIWVSPKLLKPTAKRLNPLAGLKRMFGPHAVWAMAKALGKSAALGATVYLSIRRLLPTVLGSGVLPVDQLVSIAVGTVLGMLRYAAGAGLVLAFADYAVVRRRTTKALRMTKQEIKEELRSSEGDPHLKAAVRSRQIAMRRNRMMADVPSADVVIVNPTHVAVALKYEPSRGAPRVVAKGGDHLAARIRAVAEQHRVPMVTDVPLARTLFGTCEVGQEIPPDLYKAVATVLAFIMTLARRGSTAGTHTVRPLPAARPS